MSRKDLANTARKKDIQKRLNIAKYSKPENIIYSDENDHNPLILEKCPICNGTGKNCQLVTDKNGENTELTYHTDVCRACNGDRTTGNVVRRYKDDIITIEAVVTESGWIKCPGCGISFKTTNDASWSGLRHKTCGQKIILCNNAVK